MLTVQFSVGEPCQVEFPAFQIAPNGRALLDDKKQPVPFGERSCTGALHLQPGSVKSITAAELAHIQRFYPKVKSRVLPQPSEQPAPAPTVRPAEPEAQEAERPSKTKK
jgi:hypothetical protein